MILFVRGDLQAETGWSRATRALVAAIEGQFDKVVGADLHCHAAKSWACFGHPVFNDDTVCALLSGTPDVVVLHACQPSHIRRVHGALNLGWWFWETDSIRSELDWCERLGALDLLFVPSDWQASWVSRLGLRTPVRTLPWPHDILPERGPAHGQPVGVVRAYRPLSRRQLGQLDGLGRHHPGLRQVVLAGQATTLDLGAHHGRYAFTVLSDAPRKGLACLLAEWLAYRADGGRLDTLLVRFAGLDALHDAGQLLVRFTQIALAAMRGREDALGDLLAVVEPMSEHTLNAAFVGAAALVVATLGEGFGGPIVEAVQAGGLPVAPRHTACAQLMPKDYPLAFAPMSYTGSLVGQLPIQPGSGTWHPPVPGALAAALRRLDAMTEDERAVVWTSIGSHLRSLLAPDAVSERFAEALRELRAARTER